MQKKNYEDYTIFLEDYLKGRRNIKKRLFKVMFSTYRAVSNGYTDWNNAIKWIFGGAN